MFGIVRALIGLVTAIVGGAIGLVAAVVSSCFGLALAGMILIALAAALLLHLV